MCRFINTGLQLTPEKRTQNYNVYPKFWLGNMHQNSNLELQNNRLLAEDQTRPSIS